MRPSAPREEDLAVVKARLLKKITRLLLDKQGVPQELRDKLAKVERQLESLKNTDERAPPISELLGAGGPAPIDPHDSTTGFFNVSLRRLWDKAISTDSILASNAKAQQAGDEAGASSVPKDVDTSYGFDNFQVTILIVGVALALYLNYRS